MLLLHTNPTLYHLNSTMTPEEIAEQVISLYGNKNSDESISISQEAPRPTSVLSQAKSYMKGRYNA